jgi:hypothetical protein
MTATVVDALMLHNQTCVRCQAGSPCFAAEYVLEEWLRQVASERPAAHEPSWWIASAA